VYAPADGDIRYRHSRDRRTISWSVAQAANRRHRVERRGLPGDVVPVAAGQADGRRDAVPVDRSDGSLSVCGVVKGLLSAGELRRKSLKRE
jgi:hypothetical protein